jgi:hypothetical protein
MLETAVEELKQILGTSKIQIKPYLQTRQDSSPTNTTGKSQAKDSPAE